MYKHRIKNVQTYLKSKQISNTPKDVQKAKQCAKSQNTKIRKTTMLEKSAKRSTNQQTCQNKQNASK